MKRVLYLAPYDFNKFGGGSQAVRAYMDSVLDIFGKERVDVMTGSEFKMLHEYEDLNFILVQRRLKIRSYFDLLLGNLERWIKPIKNHLSKNKYRYDLVIINGGKMGVVVPFIKKLGINVVTIHHNEEIEYCMDNKNVYTFWGRCDYFVRRAQGIAYKYSDINIFLTMQDKNLLHSIYGENDKKNVVLGVYDYKSAPIVTSFSISNTYHLGISGSLVNYQTTHGIMDIKNNYWDIIMELIPDLRLLLTGRSPSEEIIDFANSKKNNIAIIPSPQDILSVIQKASIYLCPTDIGGGLKLRAMDGLKLGMPILVHQVSARGYDMFIGKPYFRVYNNRETFRKGLSDLINYVEDLDVVKRKKISEEFYAFFGYQSGTTRMRNLLKENSDNR